MTSTVDDVNAYDSVLLEALLGAASPAAVDVFTYILTHGPIARIDVSRLTGLSQAAVTKAVAPLVAAGLVTDAPSVARVALPGRPVRPLRVVPEALYYLGVKVNANAIIGVATDLNAEVRESAHQVIANTSFDTIVDGVAAVVDRLRSLLGSRAERLAGIGVAVSGDVDTENGIVRESALLGWTDAPLGDALSSRLKEAVLIENDVRALTIGEHWFGQGVGTNSFAIVTIGEGIGCGLHLNGEVVEGAHGVAGEIGHLPLASPEYVCHCGRRGCVESVASSGAIVAAVAAVDGRSGLTIQDVARSAHDGDPVAIAAYAKAGAVIGTAIATMVNLAGPELVLIGGEAVIDFDLYDASLRRAFAEHAFGAAVDCPIVVRSHHFEDWARGAAASAIRAIVLQRFHRSRLRPRTRPVTN